MQPTGTTTPATAIRPVWLILAGTGVAVYMLVAILSDREALVDGVVRLGVGGVTLILALSLLNYALRFARWHQYARRYGQQVPVALNALYYVAGFTFTVTPGKAGEMVRSMYLARHGVPYADSLAMFFVERLLDLLAILLLASLILLDHAEFRHWALAGFVLAVGVLAVFRSGLLARAIGWFSVRLPARLQSAGTMAARTVERASELFGMGMVALGLAIGLVAWAAEGVGLGFLASGLGYPIGMVQACAIYATAALAGTLVVFVPAGLGSTEVAMTALLVGQGVPLSSAIIATALCRVATLWFAVLLGIGAVAILHRVQGET